MPGAQPPPLPTAIPFGPFEADLQAQELRKLGVHVRLPRQSFQILKMLLEHPGELVTREEMRAALWPSDTFVDFEHGLNAAINRLREALGDDADHPRYIETLPRRGYRFMAPVTQPGPLQHAATTAQSRIVQPPPQTHQRNRRTLAIAAITLAIPAAVFLWFRSTSRPPPVLAYRQLTRDRQIKGQTPCGAWYNPVTDGPRIYFPEPSSTVAQVSSAGGDVLKISTPFACFTVFDISPDKSELLGEEQPDATPYDRSLWILSTASGLARRVGELTGHAGAWSPDGQRIAYATTAQNRNDVYVAAKDGTDTHRLTAIPGYVSRIRWSPNGKILRMIVCNQSCSSIWEVLADGTNLHPINLAPGQAQPILDENWSSDGRHYLYISERENAYPPYALGSSSDIWVRSEAQTYLFGTTPKFTQLTSGVISFRSVVPSLDGKHLFAVGGQFRGELVRYDLRSRKLEPYLSGISADQLDFSRDGQWVAYITFPDGILWRSKVDGSERMQLTNPPLLAAGPRWSPDGKRISFSQYLPSGHWKLFVVSAEGGKPEAISQKPDDQFDATWAADGSSLVFTALFSTPRLQIFSVELKTGIVSMITGSEGKGSPRVSPDGRFIVACEWPGNEKQFLFDWRSQRWSELPRGALGWQAWSSDSRFAYFVDLRDRRTPTFYRVRPPDRRLERVATFTVPEGTTGLINGWAGVAPDGSPLLVRDLSMWEIYALDVDLP